MRCQRCLSFLTVSHELPGQYIHLCDFGGAESLYLAANRKKDETLNKGTPCDSSTKYTADICELMHFTTTGMLRRTQRQTRPTAEEQRGQYPTVGS